MRTMEIYGSHGETEKGRSINAEPLIKSPRSHFLIRMPRNLTPFQRKSNCGFLIVSFSGNIFVVLSKFMNLTTKTEIVNFFVLKKVKIFDIFKDLKIEKWNKNHF